MSMTLNSILTCTASFPEVARGSITENGRVFRKSPRSPSTSFHTAPDGLVVKVEQELTKQSKRVGWKELQLLNPEEETDAT